MKHTNSLLIGLTIFAVSFFASSRLAWSAIVLIDNEVVVLVSGSSPNGVTLSGVLRMPLEALLPTSGSSVLFTEISSATIQVTNHPTASYNGLYDRLVGGGLQFNNVLLYEPEVIGQSLAIINRNTGAYLYASSVYMNELFFLGDTASGPAFRDVTWTVVPETSTGMLMLTFSIGCILIRRRSGHSRINDSQRNSWHRTSHSRLSAIASLNESELDLPVHPLKRC